MYKGVFFIQGILRTTTAHYISIILRNYIHKFIGNILLRKVYNLVESGNHGKWRKRGKKEEEEKRNKRKKKLEEEEERDGNDEKEKGGR